MTIRNLETLLDHFSTFENALALEDCRTGETLTYAELVHAVYAASELLGPRLQKGQRVVLYKLPSLSWVIWFFAVGLRGGVVVTIEERGSEEFTGEVFDLTTPSLLLHHRQLSKKYDEYGIISWDLSTVTLQPRTAPPTTPTNPHAPAEIIFTSGTWSRPKGVTLSMHNLLSNAQEICQNVYPLRPRERFLSILPLSHAYEQTIGLLCPLLSGGSVSYSDPTRPTQLLADFARVRPHYLATVPKLLTVFERKIRRQAQESLPAWLFDTLLKIAVYLPGRLRRQLFKRVHAKFGSCLQTFFVGGAPLEPQTGHFFEALGIETVVGYGLSETAPLVTYSRRSRREYGEIGHALSNLETKIGETGELLVRGPSVFLGYWPDIERDAQAYFNTSDVVTRTNSGAYRLQGRSKNLVVYPSGDKIFCEDIEYHCTRITHSAEVCVLNTGTDSTPRLTLVLGQDTPAEDLQTTLTATLPDFARIDSIRVYPHPELPKTRTQKIARARLRRWLLEECAL